MKLLRFKDKSNEQTRVGAIKNKNIVDLSEVNLPTDMIDFINLGDQGLETAKEFLDKSSNIPANKSEYMNDITVILSTISAFITKKLIIKC